MHKCHPVQAFVRGLARRVEASCRTDCTALPMRGVSHKFTAAPTMSTLASFCGSLTFLQAPQQSPLDKAPESLYLARSSSTAYNNGVSSAMPPILSGPHFETRNSVILPVAVITILRLQAARVLIETPGTLKKSDGDMKLGTNGTEVHGNSTCKQIN